MGGTFFGFETVKKALTASQLALNVASQNVSNANTEGYTRQRVDLSSITSDSGASKFGKTTGQSAGRGVEVTGISQIRDKFIDLRYRNEAAEFGTLSASTTLMGDIENIIDEASSDGLGSMFADMYKKLESFSVNVDSVEYASIFRSSAKKAIEILNQYSSSLDTIYDEYVYNTSTEVSDVNQNLIHLAKLNAEIKSEYVQGNVPNELLDSQNLILDKLSSFIGASYEFDSSGQASVKLGGVYLVDSSKNNKIEKLVFNSDSPVSVSFESGAKADIAKGSISGYLSGINGKGSFASAGENNNLGIVYFKESLNSLAKSFAESFNNVNDPTGSKKLFVSNDGSEITAGNLTISSEWANDALFITQSTGTGGGSDANKLLSFLDMLDSKKSVTSSFSGTFDEYVVSLISDASSQVEYLKDLKDTSESVLNTISDEREAVMGVSTDEESINMVRFQKSYNAAAQVMKTLNEMLDVLINSVR